MKKKFFALMMAMTMVLSLAACGGETAETTNDDTTSEDTASGTAFKIGTIGPLTGDAAIYGQAVANGAAIAVEEINAAGGDIQFELKSEDDVNDGETSVNAYNTLMDWGMQLLVGPTTTGPSVSVAAKCYEDRTFMLTPSASSTDVIADKDNVYQVCFTDPAQGAASAQYIAEHGLATKVAVIYNNGDVYSTGIYQTFEAKAAELGLEIVKVTTFTDETTDFSVQVTETKNAGAELVFLPIYYTPASMILTQAASMDYSPIFFGVDGMDGILTMEGFDTSLAEGVLLLTPFSADAKDEKTVNFVNKYVELYGDTPNQFAIRTVDVFHDDQGGALRGENRIHILSAGGVTADTTPEETCEIMIEQMQKLTIEGLTGTMTWSATGEVSKTPTAVKIENGVYVGME